MPLLDQIETDLDQAFRAGHSTVVGPLRMVKASLQNAAIAKGAPLDDSEVVSILRKEVKKREEAATLYEQHGSADRAASERSEAAVFAPYLPAALDEAVIASYVTELVSSGAAADMGTAMRLTMAHFAGQSADGKTVSRIIADALKAA